MKERAIDAIARALATGLPRRRLVGGLAAALALPLLGRLPEAAAAGCKKVGKECDQNQDCCDGAECKGGECKCKDGRDECGGKCYKLNNDESHCGACNNACPANGTCQDGGCAEGGYTFALSWGGQGSADGQFTGPSGIAVSDGGDIYVADAGNHRIQRFLSDGTFLSAWGSQGTGDGQFWEPRGVAVGPSGNVYVVDAYSTNRVQKFDSAGSFLLTWGSSGSDAGEFDRARGIAVSDGARVYVADTFNDRIQKFRTDGSFVTTFGTSWWRR